MDALTTDKGSWLSPLSSLLSFLQPLTPDAQPLPALVALLILAAAAAIDARTGRVPDPLIFLGLFIVTVARGFLSGWDSAAHYLLLAIAAAIFLWGVNELWYRWKKSDALGMGDSKWTMLAVAAFGLAPAAIAWVAGAWLALFYMGVRLLCARLRDRNRNGAASLLPRVHFAPFLFFGLLAGIYFIRFSGGI